MKLIRTKDLVIKKFLLLFLFLAGIVNMMYAENQYYRRNIVVLVDQTPEIQTFSNEYTREQIYNFLTSLFNGEQTIIGSQDFTTDLKIDPEKDIVSVYGFGIEGCGNPLSGDYKRINNLSNYSSLSNELLYKEFIKSLIYPCISISNSVEDNLKQALGVKGQCTYRSKRMQDPDIKATTMSYYIYPGIWDYSLLDRSKPAQEYIIIMVTNFQSGADDLGTSQDIKVLKQMLGEFSKTTTPRFNYVNKQLSLLERPFYKIPIIKYDAGNKVKVEGFRLGLISLEGVTSYITSNLTVKETDEYETTYNVEGVDISFNRDNSLAVDDIEMSITNKSEGDKVLYKKSLIADAKYDDRTKSYSFPSFTTDLGKVFQPGEVLNFKYLFFTSAKDKDGKTVLPMVFSAERDYNITTDTLVIRDREREQRDMIIKIVTALVIAGLISAAVWYLRGRKRKIGVGFKFIPISSEKFMEVKGKKVYAYDCWYIPAGQTSRYIPVSGEISIEDKAFAKGKKYNVYAKIDDIDDNEDFSFRPDPNKLKSNGSRYGNNEWFSVMEQIDSTNKFSFNVEAFIEDGCTPDWSRDNVLKVKVVVVCVEGELDANGNGNIVKSIELKYEFIAKEAIQNTNLWVAFDPGTTGSCVAYGLKSAPTADDDIFMAQNSVDQNKDSDSYIFPSEITVIPSSKRLFDSEVEKDAVDDVMHSLTEAKVQAERNENDFYFGTLAGMYSGNTGVNHFQSIKKMLGYTTKYLIVGANGNKLEVTGQSLAHLLVKGLYNHVSMHIENSSDVPAHIKGMFVKDGEFTPQRAIVAVPNNYTMSKVQDMVDTVKNTQKFKEVHFIYEAESVMMMYLRENWMQLPKMDGKTFVVYDMGGATINTTAFRIKVTEDAGKNGNKFISNVTLETIGKVGYMVGGDNIDYAIIQMIYSLPCVQRALNGTDSFEHQLKNKSRLIKMARELKLQFIAKERGDEESKWRYLVSEQALFDFIAGYDGLGSTGLRVKHNGVTTDEDGNDIVQYDEKLSDIINKVYEIDEINDYVYYNVYDAVCNLLRQVKLSECELLMSGRSVLFPGVIECVSQAFEDEKVAYNIWSGLSDKNGYPDENKVKTAVAQGACWYAMYSDKVSLSHSILTSAFGYIDDNSKKFVPVLDVNTRFGADNMAEADNEPTTQLNHLKFIQMLCGSQDYEEVIEKDIKHKYNVLDEIYSSVISTSVENVHIIVDEQGNFDYAVRVQGFNGNIVPRESVSTDTGKDKLNEFSRLGDKEIAVEVAEENSPAYAFSTYNQAKDPDAIENYIKDSNKFGERKQVEDVTETKKTVTKKGGRV